MHECIRQIKKLGKFVFFIHKQNGVVLVVLGLVHTLFWHGTSTAYTDCVNIDLV